jgi:uncharacterized protein (TIGR00730 family)
MKKTICVFCASSSTIHPAYFPPARRLGELLADHNYTLMYGGGKAGLMGALVTAYRSHGGKVRSVIPELFVRKGWCYEQADRIIKTKTMQERKALMCEKSSGFIALPGGNGTLDEILDVLTTKQLGFHNKPVILLNSRGFFNPLLRIFKRFYTQGFVPQRLEDLFIVIKNPENALKHL